MRYIISELDEQEREETFRLKRFKQLKYKNVEQGVKPKVKDEPPPEPTPKIKIKDKKVKVEPVKVEPTKVEPVKVEPIKVEPVKVEPIKVEPVKVEPIKVEPIKAEPIKAEPIKAEPIKVEPCRGEPMITDTKIVAESPTASIICGCHLSLNDIFDENNQLRCPLCQLMMKAGKENEELEINIVLCKSALPKSAPNKERLEHLMVHINEMIGLAQHLAAEITSPRVENFIKSCDAVKCKIEELSSPPPPCDFCADAAEQSEIKMDQSPYTTPHVSHISTCPPSICDKLVKPSEKPSVQDKPQKIRSVCSQSNPLELTPATALTLGYFEKEYNEIVKVTRSMNPDGTFSEEKQVITITTERRNPRYTNEKDDNFNQEKYLGTCITDGHSGGSGHGGADGAGGTGGVGGDGGVCQTGDAGGHFANSCYSSHSASNVASRECNNNRSCNDSHQSKKRLSGYGGARGFPGHAYPTEYTISKSSNSTTPMSYLQQNSTIASPSIKSVDCPCVGSYKTLSMGKLKTCSLKPSPCTLVDSKTCPSHARFEPESDRILKRINYVPQSSSAQWHGEARSIPAHDNPTEYTISKSLNSSTPMSYFQQKSTITNPSIKSEECACVGSHKTLPTDKLKTCSIKPIPCSLVDSKTCPSHARFEPESDRILKRIKCVPQSTSAQWHGEARSIPGHANPTEYTISKSSNSNTPMSYFQQKSTITNPSIKSEECACVGSHKTLPTDKLKTCSLKPSPCTLLDSKSCSSHARFEPESDRILKRINYIVDTLYIPQSTSAQWYGEARSIPGHAYPTEYIISKSSNSSTPMSCLQQKSTITNASIKSEECSLKPSPCKLVDSKTCPSHTRFEAESDHILKRSNYVSQSTSAQSCWKHEQVNNPMVDKATYCIPNCSGLNKSAQNDIHVSSTQFKCFPKEKFVILPSPSSSSNSKCLKAITNNTGCSIKIKSKSPKACNFEKNDNDSQIVIKGCMLNALRRIILPSSTSTQCSETAAETKNSSICLCCQSKLSETSYQKGPGQTLLKHNPTCYTCLAKRELEGEEEIIKESCVSCGTLGTFTSASDSLSTKNSTAEPSLTSSSMGYSQNPKKSSIHSVFSECKAACAALAKHIRAACSSPKPSEICCPKGGTKLKIEMKSKPCCIKKDAMTSTKRSDRFDIRPLKVFKKVHACEKIRLRTCSCHSDSHLLDKWGKCPLINRSQPCCYYY